MATMNKHTLAELQQMQSLPLDGKISMTIQRIKAWINEYGTDGVYVSFSGGKDSTVLLDIVRNKMGYKDIPAVFCDTGLEYPEIRDFVKTFDNVIWLKPKLTFRQIIEKYGYPLISKEVANCIRGARKYLTNLKTIENSLDNQIDKPIQYSYYMADILGIERRLNKNNPKYIAIQRGEIPSESLLTNEFEDYSKDKKNKYKQTKYKFLLKAPFNVSEQCCNEMKKKPAALYSKKTGRKPILGIMAEESMLRKQKWLRQGCNAFDRDKPESSPMSFWLEQDILNYVVRENIPICSVYGDIVEDTDNKQYDLFGEEKTKLKTTGCKRTGCVYCGFGCQLNNDQRFVMLKETHPQIYEYIMKSWDEGGLDYKNIFNWINENSEDKVHIKY